MATPSVRRAPRFHRRILSVGAVFTVLLLVIGAPFFANRIEDDLEHRVPSELTAAGFEGITASFSGQDGTLTCDKPLDDPELARSTAYDVWGVRSIDVDRTCRVNRAPIVETTTTAVGGTDASRVSPVSTPAAGDDGTIDDTVSGSTVVTTIAPDFDTLVDIITTSPQLSLLAVLMQEAGLTELDEATPDRPVTLFAPTDEAFDALPADAFAKLRADPEVLRRVLSHHAAAGALLVSDLVAGPLETLDGGSLEIGSDGATVTVSGAMVLASDIAAANGVVHVIDAVLVPDDVDLTVVGRLAVASATLQNEAVTLSGIVASEVERAVLLQAAAGPGGSLPVDDRLTVDPDIGIDAATTVSLAQLVAVMSANLLDGVSGFDGSGWYVSGTYRNDAGRDAVLAAAEAVSAAAELLPPPTASTIDATDLEAELNAYVAANPILFESGSSLLTESSVAVLDQVAIELQRFGGVAITVEGHTDSDGNPAENVTLSQYRALVVRQALIDRGIDADSITARGFGSERPILVDGVEDKLASRRVEFRVVATS